MIRTIRLDQKDNYLIDCSTGEIVDRYDPNKNLQLSMKLDGSTLKVSSEKIIVEYGGQIVIQHNDDKFILEDGYQNLLTKSGYIVYKNYDDDNIFDKSKGIRTRDFIMKNISDSIDNISENYKDMLGDNNESTEDNEYIFGGENAPYKFTIIVDTVNSIVTKNQLRKDNSLAFYPFNKDMDKFGTIYISIFAQKLRHLSKEEVNMKYQISDSIIRDLTNDLGSDYHFIPNMIKKRVIRFKGL